MVVILVHWLIKDGMEDVFQSRWKQMSVGAACTARLLLRLTLGQPTPISTRSVLVIRSTPRLSILACGKALKLSTARFGKCIPEAEIVERQGRQKLTIELEEFEFKLRGRVILEVVSDRGSQLPEAALQE